MTILGWFMNQSLIQCVLVFRSHPIFSNIPTPAFPSLPGITEPCKQFFAMIACRTFVKFKYAYLGVTLDSAGCDSISTNCPYFRNKEYRSSCESSEASCPPELDTNSTFNLELGNRHRSSTQGLPWTKQALTR